MWKASLKTKISKHTQNNASLLQNHRTDTAKTNLKRVFRFSTNRPRLTSFEVLKLLYLDFFHSAGAYIKIVTIDMYTELL
jgi:hypothetical protein